MQKKNEEKILNVLKSIDERLKRIEERVNSEILVNSINKALCGSKRSEISSRELYQAVKKEAIDYSTRDKHEED